MGNLGTDRYCGGTVEYLGYRSYYEVIEDSAPQYHPVPYSTCNAPRGVPPKYPSVLSVPSVPQSTHQSLI